MDFLGENKTPRDPMEWTVRAAQLEQLKQACFDFSLRVLKGENVQPQETAILPEVLKELERISYKTNFNDQFWEMIRSRIIKIEDKIALSWVVHALEAVALALLTAKLL